MTQDSSRLRLILYFVLTFAVSWLLWIIGSGLSHGLAPGVRAFFFLPGTFGPALVAIALTHHERGGAGVRQLVGAALRAPATMRFYLFAFSFMAIVKLTAAGAYRVFYGAWPHFGVWNPLLLLAATLFSTPFQSGEEIGWRGYALPRLGAHMSLATASLLLGVIWACWHLPLFYIDATDSTGQPFIIFLLYVTAISVVIAWLYAVTGGSLLMVMFMHASINNTRSIVSSTAPAGTDPFVLRATPVAWLTVVVLWLAAFYFLFRLRRVRAIPA